MISDILFQAVVDLDHYLNDPNFDRTYSGELRERIIRLRDEAEYIRFVLDTHPCDTPPNEAVLRERIAADLRQVRDRRSLNQQGGVRDHTENGGGEITPAVQREAAAYHEAGHVVIADYVGWWVNPEGVEIDQRQYTGLRCNKEDDSTEKAVLVDLAGWLSEFEWHGRDGLRSDDDLMSAIQEVRDCGDFTEEPDEDWGWGDDEEAFHRLLGDFPGASDDELLVMYRDYQVRVQALLKDPAIWRAIEAVAAALTVKGRLNDNEVLWVIQLAGLTEMTKDQLRDHLRRLFAPGGLFAPG
jgi:hypothetical protein